MYDFSLYAGKTEASVPDKYYHLQKCAQFLARLCEHLQGNIALFSQLVYHDRPFD